MCVSLDGLNQSELVVVVHGILKLPEISHYISCPTTAFFSPLLGRSSQ